MDINVDMDVDIDIDIESIYLLRGPQLGWLPQSSSHHSSDVAMVSTFIYRDIL